MRKTKSCMLCFPGVAGKYQFQYLWQTRSIIQQQPSRSSKTSTNFFSVNGLVPCCVPSKVPNSTDVMGPPVDVGGVLGWCDVGRSTATITWLGDILPQSFDQAELLCVLFTPLPGTSQEARYSLGTVAFAGPWENQLSVRRFKTFLL